MSLFVVEGSCRICFIETNNLLHLLDIVDGMQSRIVELLENCGGIKVDLTDYFSKSMCENCTRELLACAKFREKCKKSQEILSRVDEVEEFRREEESQEPLEEIQKGLDVLVSDEETNQVAIYKIEIEEDQESDLSEGDEKLKKASGENEVSEIDYIFDDNSREDVEILEADFADAIVKDGVKNKPSLPELKPKANQELCNVIVRSTDLKKVGPSSKATVINFSCDACGAGFYQIKNLRKHLESHNPDKIYTCSNCDCVFTQIDNLEVHMAKEHPNQSADDERTANPIDCEATNSQESPPSNAKKKLSTETVNLNLDPKNAEVTTNKRPNRHVCSHCQKGFASKSALNSHVRIHTGDRPFQCKDCDKAFTTQGALVLHTRRHSGLRPFSCSVCGKGFTESSNLKVHMRTHTGEKPHQCTICDRKFARVFLLQIHLRTHTGEKPYKCSSCDKAFAQRGDLSAHKRIHTGERPHTCPYCKKGFIKSSALSQHIRKHTKKGEIEANDALSIKDFEILELEDAENVQ